MPDHGVQGNENHDQDRNDQIGHSLVAHRGAGAVIPDPVFTHEQGECQPGRQVRGDAERILAVSRNESDGLEGTSEVDAFLEGYDDRALGAGVAKAFGLREDLFSRLDRFDLHLRKLFTLAHFKISRSNGSLIEIFQGCHQGPIKKADNLVRNSQQPDHRFPVLLRVKPQLPGHGKGHEETLILPALEPASPCHHPLKVLGGIRPQPEDTLHVGPLSVGMNSGNGPLGGAEGIEPGPRPEVCVTTEAGLHGFKGDRREGQPVLVAQQHPFIGSIIGNAGVGGLVQAFHIGKGHDRKGQNDQGDAGQTGPELPSIEVGNPDGKSGPEGFPLARLGGAGIGPALFIGHFFFEMHENDPGNQERQSHDKERDDHHHRAVRKLEGGMEGANRKNGHDQDQEEGYELLINIAEAEEITFHAVGKRHEEGNEEHDPGQNIPLGCFNLAVNRVQSRPGSDHVFPEDPVLLLDEPVLSVVEASDRGLVERFQIPVHNAVLNQVAKPLCSKVFHVLRSLIGRNENGGRITHQKAFPDGAFGAVVEEEQFLAKERFGHNEFEAGASFQEHRNGHCVPTVHAAVPVAKRSRFGGGVEQGWLGEVVHGLRVEDVDNIGLVATKHDQGSRRQIPLDLDPIVDLPSLDLVGGPRHPPGCRIKPVRF